MDLLHSFEGLVALVLPALLLILLARGHLPSYILLALYSLVDLATGLTEEVALRTQGRGSALYHDLFWGNEVATDFLMFVLVIVLIRRSAEQAALRTAASRILLLVIGAAAVLPFLYGHRLLTPVRGTMALANGWFRLSSQILNFGAAIMNLVLWTALIGSKKSDTQLLTVSAGLGVLVTGQAFSYGITILTRAASLRSLGDLIVSLTHILGLAIWCWAFWPKKRLSDPK